MKVRDGRYIWREVDGGVLGGFVKSGKNVKCGGESGEKGVFLGVKKGVNV